MLEAIILSAITVSFAFIHVEGFTSRVQLQDSSALSAVNGIWNTGNDFGKGKFRFYDGLDSYMKPFPDEDRQLYPEMFRLPKGMYEVPLARPCGIIFEEIKPNRGVSSRS
jgi:hypothetical protein